MMRNPRARTSALPAEDELPACRSYRSLSDAALQPRKPRVTRVMVAGLGVAALVVGAGWALRPAAQPTRNYAAVPYVPAGTSVPSGTGAPQSNAAAPGRVHAAPQRARFQVAGVRVVASRKPLVKGAVLVALSPGVGLAHAASVESGVLLGMDRGLASKPHLVTTRYRGHVATVEHYVTTSHRTMSALCVQWTAHTAYVLRAPSGPHFTALLARFQPR